MYLNAFEGEGVLGLMTKKPPFCPYPPYREYRRVISGN
jgi:hypothetical protein